MMLRNIFTILFVGIVLSACLKDKSIEPVVVYNCDDSNPVSFQDELLPEIFTANCIICHSGADPADGRTWENYDQISGDAELIIKAISHDPSVTAMPLNQTQLTDTLIQKFQCWIDQGKLDN